MAQRMANEEFTFSELFSVVGLILKLQTSELEELPYRDEILECLSHRASERVFEEKLSVDELNQLYRAADSLGNADQKSKLSANIRRSIEEIIASIEDELDTMTGAHEVDEFFGTLSRLANNTGIDLSSVEDEIETKRVQLEEEEAQDDVVQDRWQEETSVAKIDYVFRRRSNTLTI
jgi:hypothetical protein